MISCEDDEPFTEIRYTPSVKTCLPVECCFHEHERNTTTWGNDGVMIKVERCCNCGGQRIFNFKKERDIKHGPFAPRVWRLMP
jgi:hypothetical protein